MTKYKLRKLTYLDNGDVSYTVDPLGQVFNRSPERLVQSIRLASGDEFLREPGDELTTISALFVRDPLGRRPCLVSPVTSEEMERFVRAYRDEWKKPLEETRREFQFSD